MSLKATIGDAISGWFAKRPEIEKAISGEISEWLAKQPGADDLELPLRCSACSYEWTCKVDLTKTNLVAAMKAAVRCPICGAEQARIRR
jgi:rubrerythrin